MKYGHDLTATASETMWELNSKVIDVNSKAIPPVNALIEIDKLFALTSVPPAEATGRAVARRGTYHSDGAQRCCQSFQTSA